MRIAVGPERTARVHPVDERAQQQYHAENAEGPTAQVTAHESAKFGPALALGVRRRSIVAFKLECHLADRAVGHGFGVQRFGAPLVETVTMDWVRATARPDQLAIARTSQTHHTFATVLLHYRTTSQDRN